MDNLPLKNLNNVSPNKIFLAVLVASIVLGIFGGYYLSGSGKSQGGSVSVSETKTAAKSAQQDNKTFRDFAEGTIKKRPDPKNADEYVEGTHLLVRNGAMPVALTSSVVDLSEYEGKQVKVYGETQKALKEGWLMDIGKVEVK